MLYGFYTSTQYEIGGVKLYMKYTSIVLQGYKRMALNNINLISIEFTQAIQLILGTNGSGKSSLISEISPLPGNALDYTSEGSKKVSIEHHSNLYELVSIFAPTVKHSFSKDGVELNKGGTASVQRELVRKEFGITPEIHDLVIGQTNFTSMDTGTRRYWFTMLSDTSYDYAIKIYNKLCEKSRDVVGSLKTAKKRLVTETSKIISEEEKTNLVEQIHDLHRVLQEMLEFRQPTTKTTAEIESKAISIEKEIIALSRNLIKTKLLQAGKHNYSSLDAISQDIVNLEADTIVYKKLIDKYFEEHTSLQETIEILKAKGDHTLEELIEHASLTEKAIDNVLDTLKLGLVFEDYEHASIALETVYETITSVSSIIAINKNREFNKNNFVETNEKLLSQKTLLLNLTHQLNTFHAQKDHQDSHKTKSKIDCPKCLYSWSQGFDEELYEKILTAIENTQNRIDEVTTNITILEETKESILEYTTLFKQYQSCINNWPILDPLWDYLLTNKIITDEPRSLQAILGKLRYDFTLNAKVKVLTTELNRVKEVLRLSKQIGDEDINKTQLHQTRLENDIETTTGKLQTSLIAYKKLVAYKKDVENNLDLADKIDVLSRVFNSMYDEHKTILRNDALTDMIRGVQLILAKKEQLLSEINMQQAIIKDIQDQILYLELEDVSYKGLIKELSPTEGLIAEGMLGFISNFTKQINSFIDRVWTYKLEVVPCGMEDDGSIELNYKFPIKVDSLVATAPDVKKGSTSMRQIIDLAFRITAMKYLGLSDSPAYLDEFGSGLDAAHRVNAMQVVKTLIEDQPFTQLFMVSHYETSYGSLNNAEICVIGMSNIIIPKDAIVNRHVRIN